VFLVVVSLPCITVDYLRLLDRLYEEWLEV
jgi:hypothetical protein